MPLENKICNFDNEKGVFLANSFSKLLKQQLEDCQKQNLWRNRECIQNQNKNFCGNDYLGLANHPSIKSVFKNAVDKYGIGGTGACLLGGYNTSYKALEEELASFTGFQRTLIFSTGYLANLAVVTTLSKKLNIQTIYIDRVCHASQYDGVLLSKIPFKRFHHRDTEHLKRLLTVSQKKDSHTLLLSEGLFGMEGEIADLPVLAKISEDFNSLLVIDDAHGLGVLGEKGGGVFEHFGIQPLDNTLLVGTFGKAIGTMGAFVAGSHDMIELLIQFARSYIFTTALPPAIIESTRTSLEILQRETWRREYLYNLIRYFQQGAMELNIPIKMTSTITPIQIVLTYDEKSTLLAQEYLRTKGFSVGAIRPPTVPAGHCRLRINLNVSKSREEIDQLLEGLRCLKHLKLQP